MKSADTTSSPVTETRTDADRIWEKWHELEFGVKTSIRYHEHRAAWFNGWRVATDFFVILSGGTVLAEGITKGLTWLGVLGGLVAVLTTLDLVVGYSDRARDHADFLKAFVELRKKLNQAGLPANEGKLAEMANARLDIEKDEPPHLTVLNLRCHNEQVMADGSGENYLVPIAPWKSFLGNFFNVSPKTTRQRGKLAFTKTA